MRGTRTDRDDSPVAPRRGVVLAAVLIGGTVLLAPAAGETLPTKTLEECIAIALASQPTLKAADATVVATTQQVWQAASSYLPQIGAGYSAERRKTSLGATTGTDFGNQSRTFNFYSTGLGFTQILFDFGQNLDAIRAAQANRRAADANRATEQETVIFDVKQSYYNLLAARRLLDVADETVRQTGKQLEQAEGRHEVGLAPKFDVTRAQVQVAQAELNQVTTRNAVAVARETLRNALGLDGPLDFDIVDSLALHPVEIDEAYAVERAYANRPELRSLVAQQQAQREQIDLLQKNYLPFVTGRGNYEWEGSSYPLQDTWNIGAAVSLSLFSGGLTTAQVSEAKANLLVLEFNEQSTRQDIALQVRQSRLDLARAAESIRVTEKGVEQARESRLLAEGRYNTGVGNIIELTDAQASYTSAEGEAVRALYSYQIALAALERAIGATVVGKEP